MKDVTIATTEVTKEAYAMLLNIRKVISDFENKYDNLKVSDVLSRSEREQGFIEGWIVACQEIKRQLHQIDSVRVTGYTNSIIATNIER